MYTWLGTFYMLIWRVSTTGRTRTVNGRTLFIPHVWCPRADQRVLADRGGHSSGFARRRVRIPNYRANDVAVTAPEDGCGSAETDVRTRSAHRRRPLYERENANHTALRTSGEEQFAGRDAVVNTQYVIDLRGKLGRRRRDFWRRRCRGSHQLSRVL